MKTQPSKPQQVNSTHGKSVTQIVLQGQCNKKDATFFIDTGSSVTLISKAFIDTIGISNQIRPTSLKLSSFTSNRIKTYGEVWMDVELAGCHVSHKMIITDMVDSTCLIGMDFLSQHQMNVDVVHRRLTSKRGETAFLPTPRQLKKRGGSETR